MPYLWFFLFLFSQSFQCATVSDHANYKLPWLINLFHKKVCIILLYANKVVSRVMLKLDLRMWTREMEKLLLLSGKIGCTIKALLCITVCRANYSYHCKAWNSLTHTPHTHTSHTRAYIYIYIYICTHRHTQDWLHASESHFNNEGEHNFRLEHKLLLFTHLYVNCVHNSWYWCML